MLHVPIEWTVVLNILQNCGFPEAILGGGALRDLDNHREDLIQDLDIFVDGTDRDVAEMLNLIWPGHVEEELAQRVATYKLKGDLGGLWCVNLPGLPKVQIIACKSMDVSLRNIAQRNDFGICQIAFDGAVVFRTDYYVVDRVTKTFTLRNCNDKNAFDRSLRRYQRISDRYDWPLSIPTEFRHHAEDEF